MIGTDSAMLGVRPPAMRPEPDRAKCLQRIIGGTFGGIFQIWISILFITIRLQTHMNPSLPPISRSNIDRKEIVPARFSKRVWFDLQLRLSQVERSCVRFLSAIKSEDSEGSLQSDDRALLSQAETNSIMSIVDHQVLSQLGNRPGWQSVSKE